MHCIRFQRYGTLHECTGGELVQIKEVLQLTNIKSPGESVIHEWYSHTKAITYQSQYEELVSVVEYFCRIKDFNFKTCPLVLKNNNMCFTTTVTCYGGKCTVNVYYIKLFDEDAAFIDFTQFVKRIKHKIIVHSEDKVIFSFCKDLGFKKKKDTLIGNI